MSFKLSRRKMLLASGAAVISPLVLPGDRRALADTVQVSTSGYAVSVVSGSDLLFGGAVEALYPGLTKDPTFQQIAPLALLVTHQQGPPVRGFSVAWAITTPAGKKETPLYFYVSLGSPLTGHIQSALGSARRNILQIGQSRLVTPFFSWTPADYGSNSAQNWDEVLKRSYPGKFLVSELPAATQVKVSMDAVVFSDWKMIGPNKHKLGTKIRARRNAEHDEGLSLYKLMNNGASDNEIIETLRAHGLAQRSYKENLGDRWYERSRRFHAQVLLKAFQNADRQTFTRALVRLTRQRKNLITRADA